MNTFFTFIFLTYGGIISHLLILLQYPKIGEREFNTLSLGLGYDLMNAALLTIILLLLSSFFSKRWQAGIYSMAVLLYLLFITIDYQYVKQFGTHLPFSTLEYLEEASNFGATLIQFLVDPLLWILFFIPVTVHLMVQLILLKKRGPAKTTFKGFFLSLIILTIVGAVPGAYSNSYLSKNLNDPLTSSALLYFYWSRQIEADVIYQKPVEALKVVRQYLAGEPVKKKELRKFPLVQFNPAEVCITPQQQSMVGRILCGVNRPNILFILLESFRAAEIGAYGSRVQLTPNFDRWSKRGIFFKNFFANGFQTRHGFVAAYCSLMPNYGPAIMKRYKRNHFLCLPEQLKRAGYRTSWIFGSDAAFDDQLYFLPHIGFEQLIDQFSFPAKTEVLGWGVSDRALFDKWLTHLEKLPEPFYSSALTITNHHPFEVPEKFQLFKADSDLHRYYEAMHYTDATLDQFLRKAQKTTWYKNSLIFIMADTANYQQPQQPYADIEDFIRIRSQIPLLILGGAVKQPLVVEDFYSQIDLAPTVMELLGKSYNSHWAGQSMLFKKATTIAYTNRPGNYWAVMSLKGKYFNENNSQDTFKDFLQPELKKEYKALGQAWIKTTNWLLQEDLYWQ